MGKPLKNITIGHHEVIRFNIMTVGEKGSGKSTFLKSIFCDYIENIDIDNIDSSCLKIVNVASFEIPSDTGLLKFHVYGAAGYGDKIDNSSCFGDVRRDLLDRHKNWRELDGQVMTDEERVSLDSRIHCIFYFITPFKYREIDERFLRTFAGIVPIVPIISKSDSMNSKERKIFLDFVSSAITDMTCELNHSVIYDFHENVDPLVQSLSITCDYDDAMKASIGAGTVLAPQVDDFHMSFSDSSISSETSSSSRCFEVYSIPNIFAVVSDCSGSREYPWGKLGINDPRLSDFRRIQALLFEDSRHIRGMRNFTQEKTIALYSSKATCSQITSTGYTYLLALSFFAIYSLNEIYFYVVYQRPFLLLPYFVAITIGFFFGRMLKKYFDPLISKQLLQNIELNNS